MKAITIILIALGIIAIPAHGLATSLGKKVRTRPNAVITRERYQKIKNRTTQWKAYKPEENPFYGMDDEQLKGLIGLQGDLETVVGGTSEEELNIDQATLPANHDWRTVKPNCVGKVRNQGSCGSCWAFAGIEMLEDRLCIASNERVRVALSPQYLVSCDKSNMACRGGYMDRTVNFLINTGTVQDGCQPYVSANKYVPTCPSGCKSLSSPFTKYKCASGTTSHPTTVAGIKQEIKNYGPIQTGYQVYSDFYNYRSGIYKHVSGVRLGGHAVKIVGWGTSGGIEYWIVQNSWGATWGENGFFRIQMGQCDIEKNVWGCRAQV